MNANMQKITYPLGLAAGVVLGGIFAIGMRAAIGYLHMQDKINNWRERRYTSKKTNIPNDYIENNPLNDVPRRTRKTGLDTLI